MSIFKSIIGFFDLYRPYRDNPDYEVDYNSRIKIEGSDTLEYRSAYIKNSSRKKIPSTWNQILIYSGIVLGIFFSASIKDFKNGKIDINLSFSRFFISLLIGIIIFSILNKSVKILPETSTFSKFCNAFANGVCWDSLSEKIAL